MKTFFICLCGVLLAVHLAYGMGSKGVKELPPPIIKTPQIKVAPTVIDIKTKVEIVSLKGFSAAQEARFRRVAAVTERIINSPEFKAKIENWYYKGKKSFFDTNHSNEKVFANITKSDWKLEYRLEALRIGSKTIGYTYPSVSWIAFNSRKWSALDDSDISGNICHEFGGHKLGRYDHTSNYTPDRPYSVPYGVGYTCESLYAKYSK